MPDTVPCKQKRPHQHTRRYSGHTAKSSSWSQPRGTHRPNRTNEEYPWGGVLPVGLSVVRALGARIKVRGSRCILPVFIPLWPIYVWPGQTLVKLSPLPASTSEPVTSPWDRLALLLGPPSLAQSSVHPKELPKTHSLSLPPLFATHELSSLD